ncbi:MAG: hypothetical protein WC712_02875 [Candidatus Brocadiia bacterium]
MKYMLAAPVLFAAFLLLAAGRPDAEDIPARDTMVFRTYDFSPLFGGQPWYLPIMDAGLFPHGYEEIDDSGNWVGDIIETARRVAGWDPADKNDAIVARGQKLIVRNTPAKIAAFDAALRSLYPRYSSCQFRVALLSADGVEFPEPPGKALTFDNALASLRASGFGVIWSTWGSCVPGGSYRLFTGRMAGFVTAQEGYIADFASSSNPITKYCSTGSVLSIHASLDGDCLALLLTFEEALPEEVRTTVQNGSELSLFDIPNVAFTKRLIFDAPATRSLPFELHGSTFILLFAFEGFELPLFGGEQEQK